MKLLLPLFVVEIEKMDFIIDEAEVSDDFYCGESCSEDENSLDNDFIEDNDFVESASFYRKCENKIKFKNQQKNALEENREEKLFYGDDDQPEMFAPEDIEQVGFHDSSDYKKRLLNFKKTLLCFSDISNENHLFYSVVYALAYLKTTKPTRL